MSREDSGPGISFSFLSAGLDDQFPIAVFAVKGVAASGTLYSKRCYDTILIARQTMALFAIAWDIARQGMNLLL